MSLSVFSIEFLGKYRFDGHLIDYVKKEILSATYPKLRESHNSMKDIEPKSLFHFLTPASSSPYVKRKEDSETKCKSQHSAHSAQESSSVNSSQASRDKQKFDEIENEFAMFNKTSSELKEKVKKG